MMFPNQYPPRLFIDDDVRDDVDSLLAQRSAHPLHPDSYMRQPSSSSGKRFQSTGARPPQRDSFSPESPSPNSYMIAAAPQPGFEEQLHPGQDRKGAPARSRKTRREKPRLALAPDQPPTTQGKQRARVFVACVQCRTRKIRCDGAKPECYNCAHRTNNSDPCNYDSVPKRRGPDKVPGARQRLARGADVPEDTRRRRRRRESPKDEPKAVAPPRLPNLQGPLSPSSSHSHSSPELPDHLFNPSQIIDTPSSLSSSARLCPCHNLSICPDSSSPTFLYPPSRPAALQGSFTSPPLLADPISTLIQPASYDQYYELVSPASATSYSSLITAQFREDDLDDDGNEGIVNISRTPTVHFIKKVWWDSLLSLYLTPSNSSRSLPLTSTDRDTAYKGITADIAFLFRCSNYWFSFFHIPTFYRTYYDSTKRERMQPSLIFALLALATFWQSSETQGGRGADGRFKALRYRDEAQGYLEASYNAQCIDESLAQAAWLLALFEICAHPKHSVERSMSSMIMLDSIIRSLSLTFIDADDPDTSVFSPGSVPIARSRSASPPWSPLSVPSPTTPPVGCNCEAMTLGKTWHGVAEHTPMWHATPAWSATTDAEIRKESCRRLSWSAMTLATGHTIYAKAGVRPPPGLFVTNPANFALLFEGETLSRSPNQQSKDTIWALYDRSFLLWHSCCRMRNDLQKPDADKAQFALTAWLEADAIEAALNRHTCNLERNFIFQGREYLFNTRMCVTHEFSRFIPLASAGMNGLFDRRKPLEWLNHQKVVAERFMQGLHTVTGNNSNALVHRPFFVFWFMGQIQRSLSLWACDNTLTSALDMCKAFLPPIEYLSDIWPCPGQHERYQRLLQRVEEACIAAGVAPPSPFNFAYT